jgi:hypothetical protein
MVACLWAGVLVMSAIALINPLGFWPLLAFQVVYKVFFLLVFCLPIWLGQQSGVIPTAVAGVFAAIVVVWPFFIVMALQSGQT